MPAKNHHAYAEELERCKYTLGYIEKYFESTLIKKKRLDNEVESLKKHFNSDSSQDYIDLGINTLLQSDAGIKLRNLVTAKSRPYFARIDFTEKNKSDPEKLYIGKMSLMRDEDHNVLIVDWRAPVANLYYEGRLGDAAYNCPDGKIEGSLSLKRQFSINKGVLEEIFDIDITTNDEFLQTYLGANADNRLKEIVSTIQVEQNAIVRADMWRPLIVQGAAGSGKTTIALHRIAYLIYTFEKSFKPENFMIIAPNKLFLNYISDVLPELGVERVRQTTFEDFAMDLIGKRFKMRDENEKLVMFTKTNKSAIEKNMLRECSHFKTSMLFKYIIDNYISGIEKKLIPKVDFKIGSRIIYKYEEINHLFLNVYKMWPVVRRLDEIRKNLSNRLKVEKDSLLDDINNAADNNLINIKSKIQSLSKRQELITKVLDKRDGLIRKLEDISKKAVREYIKRINKISPINYYKELFCDKDLFNRLLSGKIDERFIGYIREYTNKNLQSGHLEIEDLAPIIYLKFRLYGIDEKIPVKHIIIDEAQDFSAFQIYVLKKIIKDSSFTLLGDLCQGIHSYRGTRSWEDITDNVFSDRKNKFLKLEQSYRTTVEIMNIANKVLKYNPDLAHFAAKPVIRHGDEPEFIKKENIEEIANDILKKIQMLKKINFKSFALICKTMDKCIEVNKVLKRKINDLHIMTGKEKEYKTGIIIVPSYLSKGLEFDVVFIPDAEKGTYTREGLDIKLLYVAVTRPLHKLYMYCTGEPTSLLK